MAKKFFLLTLSIFVAISTYFGIQEWRRLKGIKEINLRRSEKYLAFQILTKALPKLKKRWMYGDQEGFYDKKAFKCPREVEYNPYVDGKYFRCNPNYLQCFFEGNAGITNPVFKVYIQRKAYTVMANPVFDSIGLFSSKKRFYKIITRSNTEGASIPSYGVLVNLSIKEYPDYSLNVILEDSCGDTYLPQDIYAFGFYPYDRYEKDWHWDNKNRHIYIDEHLVSFRDIIEWKLFDKTAPKSIQVPNNSQEWAFPAVGLKLSEMKRFCAFRGKQLLQAHYFDAATFLKLSQKDEKLIKYEENENKEFDENFDKNMDNTEGKKNHNDEYNSDLYPHNFKTIKRSPYPWTKREHDFIQDYIEEKKHSPYIQLYENECKLVYSKECISLFSFIVFNNHSNSWVGLSDVLGGYLEVMDNPLYPNQNLKASSFYFDISSSWHQLGLRAYWDGLGFLSKNFDWSNNLYLEINEQDQAFIESPEHPKDPFKVGFRCMKYEGGN